MNPQDEALSVTQADRDSAFALDNAMSGGFLKPEERLAYLSGERDDWHNVQAFARHRLSHSTPGDAEVREAVKRSRDTAMEYAVKARIPECGKFGEIAQDLDAALSSLATPSGRAQGEVAGYLVDGEWTDAEAFKRIKYPEAHRVVTLYAAPPAQDQGEGR